MTKLTKEQIEFGKNHLGMTNLTEEYIPLLEPDRSGFSDVFYQVAHEFDISGYSKEQLDIFSNNGYHLIHVAASFNNIKALEHLINLKIDVKIPAPELSDRQAIHLAAENGRKEIVELLIKNGADIHATYEYDFQAIHLATREGHKEIVELLIGNKVDIHANSKYGRRPVHLAAENGHKEIVALLIGNKVDIHVTDYDGNKPIHLAAKNGHKETVELLLQNGANMHTVSYSGQRPIHLATINGHKETVELLIKEYKKSKKENELNTLLTSNNFAFFKKLFSFRSFFILSIRTSQERIFPVFAALYKLLDNNQKLALEENFKDNKRFKFFKYALNISRKITIDIENVVSLMIELTSVDKTYPEMETIITKKTDDIYSKLKATIQNPDKFVDYESLKLVTKLTLTAERINIPEYPNEVLNHIFAYMTGNDGINYTEALKINHPIQAVSVNEITGPDKTPDIAMSATNKTL